MSTAPELERAERYVMLVRWPVYCIKQGETFVVMGGEPHLWSNRELK